MIKRNLLFVTLVVVAIAAISHYGSKRGNEKVDQKIGLPIVDSALFESIDTILFAKEDQEVELRKNGEQWLVKDKDDFPVNMEKLFEILEKISSFKVSSIIIKNAAIERLGDFEALYEDEETAVPATIGSQLTLKRADEVLFKMVVGKNRQVATPNTGFGGTYIRLGDQKSIYLIKEALSFDANPENWLRTTLFNIAKDQIKSIGFQVKQESFEFVREEKGKPFALKDAKEGESLQSDPLSSVTNELSDFSIDGIKAFSDSVDDKKLQKVSSVSVILFDDKKIEFEILYQSKKSGKEEEKEYFVKILPSTKTYDRDIGELSEKWLFPIEKWKTEKWIKARKEYLKEK